MLIKYGLLFLLFFISCEKKTSTKVRLIQDNKYNSENYLRAYLSFIPVFSSNQLPQDIGNTQFYGQIYHIKEQHVAFMIDISDTAIRFYIDQNLNKSFKDEIGIPFRREFDVDVEVNTNEVIRVHIKADEFISSRFLSPFFDYVVFNRKHAMIQLADKSYKISLVDLQNDGFKEIYRDKLLLEFDDELRTLDIDTSKESYVKFNHGHFEFHLTDDLNYIEIFEIPILKDQ